MPIYSRFKAFERKLHDRKYYQMAKADALKNLRMVESKRGKIHRSITKQCNEYAQEVLGSQFFAPWLYAYSAVAGSFKEGWIPNNYYGQVGVPAIKGGYGGSSGLKGFTHHLFRSSLFPDLLYRVNGLWILPNSDIVNESDVKEIAFQDSEQIVFKKDNSGRGKHVYPISRIDFDVAMINKIGNGVIQKYISQHEFFNEIMTGPVATLRLTTVIDKNGKSDLRGSYLKISRSNSNVVKYHQKVLIPVDKESGQLHDQGVLFPWQSINHHPDTKTPFKGKRIPHFDKCVAAVLKLQQMIPHVQCIGWDLVVNNQNQVQIMEWNGTHNGIAESEAYQGPCFADLGWEKLWKSG